MFLDAAWPVSKAHQARATCWPAAALPAYGECRGGRQRAYRWRFGGWQRQVFGPLGRSACICRQPSLPH